MKLRADVKQATGNTRHFAAGTNGTQQIAAPMWVEIQQEGESFYLFHFDARGKCIADTWHATLDEAKAQAEFEFAISDEDWKDM